MEQTAKKPISIKRLSLAAMFLAIGLVLPFLTSQIKELGDTLLPMHFPVMLCGFICGSKYGLCIGLMLPFMRSLLFSMPAIYPNAVWMSLELAAYGFIVGFLYTKFKVKSIGAVYASLISAMLVGRIVWGVSKTVLLGLSGTKFAFEAFIAGGFIDSFPGILLQLILIPAIMWTPIIKKLSEV